MREETVVSGIKASVALQEHLLEEKDTIILIAQTLINAFKWGGKVVLFGNGGSAADAEHIAAELMGRFYKQRRPLPALALTDNSSIITAVANDYGYDYVFSRQIQGLLHKGDVAIGFSTSGSSRNVALALQEAKRLGATTIAFSARGEKINDLADVVLAVSSNDTARIQEAHITVGHIVCKIVEDAVLTRENNSSD